MSPRSGCRGGEDAAPAVSEARIARHIRSLEGVRHPAAAPAALAKAQAYIEENLRSLGYHVGLHPFTDGGQAFHNIIATRTGRSLPGKRVLVLAHYDTVAGSPGADDNASGVAVMLELAALLSDLVPERTLQFVGVNLEENAEPEQSGSGLRGSKAFARYAREEGWDIEAVVVLESVAFAGASVVQEAPAGVPVAVPAVGDFLAVIANERSHPLAARFVQGAGRTGLPVVPLVVPGNGEMLPDARRSDHAPFWDAGFPAIMLTDTTNFRNPHYHGAGDTFETLNVPFAAAVCRAVALLLTELAGSPGR
ncbi:MAG: M28 family peptidase [Geobacter sp.]|nr:MAG: M28 family peptidase [Geobacter sp.]